jgi:GNAT superfamily N-acetyltransferase
VTRPPLRIRRAEPHDRQALVAMLARCTAETRYRRFLGPVSSMPEPYLTEAVEGVNGHFALVAEAEARLVALASYTAVGDGAAELGILVEDDFQRRGLGTALLAKLIEQAAAAGLQALTATVLGAQPWLLRALRAYGPLDVSFGIGVFDVTLRRDGNHLR